MKPYSSRKFRALLPLLAAASLLAIPARAQNAPTSSVNPPASTSNTGDQPTMLEKFEVTGSYLTPAANSVAIPVIAVDTRMIENSGNATNVLEILRKTVPQFSGNGNLGSGNANVGSGSTNGGSRAALRNTDTLVLINGRRVAYAAVGATGGYQFVDLNMIPVAAIERIEVLPDGASAIYGSDAVAGVVNIILKTNYEGFEVGGRYGWATSKGHQAERSAYVVGGASTADGKSHMTLSAEWTRTDPIFNFERPYSAVTYGTPTFPGSVNAGSNYYYLNNSTNAPTVTAGGVPAATLVANGTYTGPRTSGAQFQLFNLSQYVTQTIGNERQSAVIAFDHNFNDKLKFFGDFMYVNTQTQSQINAQPITATLAAGQHGNPFNATVTARNRFIEHPRVYRSDSTLVRGVAGFRGQISDTWSWEVAADYNRVRQDFENPGVINQTNLNAAIASDLINMFARTQAPGAVEKSQAVGTATGSFVSTLSNYDFKVRGKAFELPAGAVDVAVGGEVRTERLTAVADPLSIPDASGNIGWNGGTSLSPFTADRRVKSIFAEVRVPLLANVQGAHLLELSGAVRHEVYSDTSDPTVPKITLRYLPFNDEFALRGTFSKSFTAPTLYDLFGPSGIGFTAPFTLTPSGGGAGIDNFQTNYQTTANPGLSPARATNYTAGFVYSPKAVRGLSLSVDYWKIKQSGLIQAYGGETILQDVEEKGTASQYASRVRTGSFTGAPITGPRQVSTGVPDEIYVTDALVNLSKVNIDGFDVAAKYGYTAEGVGRFDFSSNIGIYRHYRFVLMPGDPAEETVASSTITNGTIPRWQSYTSVNFSRDDYEAFVGWRSIPRVTDREDNTRIGAFNSFDASASYVFRQGRYLKGAKVTVGVNNIFNRFGPLDPTVNTDSNVDVSTYGAQGRFVFIDLRYKF